MKHPTLRRAATLALALAATSSLAAGAASASTWTVDDDKAQCPNAGFTSIQAAVNQAAPHDTVVICDGVYQEQSIPPNSPTQDPSQAGSTNGLTISKPLTIRGAGAGKVTIMPAPALGATLAGSAPFLRDGGGNVVTVSRQSLGSTDYDENFLDISGVTITSPNAYVEAGIAFFNTSGRIANSTVGPLLRAADATALAAAPHGWGVVMTNSLVGAEAGVRRELTVANSLITGYQTGGILFDDGRGADGVATTTQRSGIKEYGYVTGTRVVGSGASTVIPQTGIQYSAGARGSVTGSEITNNRYSTDLRKSVGLLLTDSASGTDPSNPALPAFTATADSFTGNGYAAFNATAANDDVRLGAPATIDGWFGCMAGPLVGAPSSFAGGTNGCQGLSGDDSTPAPSITLGTVATAAPAALTVPASTADAKPTGAFVTGDWSVPTGGTFSPLVVAADDFGVKRVSLLIDGTVIGTATAAPYELVPNWTPTSRDVGTHTLTALITDSAGQVTTTAPTTLTVLGDAFQALSLDIGSWAAGGLAVGSTATQGLTLTNNDNKAYRISGVAISGDGFSVTGGTCVAGKVLAAGASCTVTATFAPAAAGAVSGTLTLTPVGASPLTVALTGTGVAPVVPPAPEPPAPVTPAPPVVPAPPVTPAPPATTVGHVGVLTTTLLDEPDATSKGLLKVGTFRCTTACTVKITGDLKVAGKKYAVSLTRRLSAKKTTTLSIQLSSAARKALAKAGEGTLSLKITVGSKTKTVSLDVSS
jgi:hypothetical protein